MHLILAQTTDAVSTETIYAGVGVNPAMVVALLFALAGAFFVVIYFLRRRRK